VATLQADDRERIRYHLGFPNVASQASLAFGVPISVETIFIVEQAMNSLLDTTVERVRKLLGILDYIEERLIRALPHLAASELGNLKVERSDGSETDLLDKEYCRWASRLADNLGVPKYAYSLRSKAGGGKAAIVPVRR
jgi:hypothetical protein